MEMVKKRVLMWTHSCKYHTHRFNQGFFSVILSPWRISIRTFCFMPLYLLWPFTILIVRRDLTEVDGDNPSTLSPGWFYMNTLAYFSCLLKGKYTQNSGISVTHLINMLLCKGEIRLINTAVSWLFHYMLSKILFSCCSFKSQSNWRLANIVIISGHFDKIDSKANLDTPKQFISHFDKRKIWKSMGSLYKHVLNEQMMKLSIWLYKAICQAMCLAWLWNILSIMFMRTRHSASALTTVEER